MSLRKVLDNLMSIKSNFDLTELEDYINFKIHNGNYSPSQDFEEDDIVDECIEWTEKNINTHSPEATEKLTVLRKLLFLLFVKKLNTIPQSVHSNNLRTSLVHNGCNLIKMCFDQGNFSDAEYFISENLNQIKIMENLNKNTNMSLNLTLQHKRTLLKLYRIENMIKENKFHETLIELNEQKEEMDHSKMLLEYFVGLCYNFALKCKKEKKFHIALKTLLMILDLSQFEKVLTTNMKRSLYLLVYICVELTCEENWKHAVSALNITKRNGIDMFYIMFKLKILVLSGQQLCINVLEEVTEWEEITVENVNEIVIYLLKHDLASSAVDLIKKIKQKPFSKDDKFLLMKIELQIYLPTIDGKTLSFCQNLIELSKDALTSSVESLCKLVQFHAAVKFKEYIINESLFWYKFCAQLCESSNLNESLYQNIQMRICLCYLEMNEKHLAEKTFFELKRNFFTDDSLYVYLTLQVSFSCNNEVLIVETLNAHGESSKIIEKVLISCCSQAFLSGKREFAIKCLEAITLKYKNENNTVLLAKALKCLIGLRSNYEAPINEEVQEKYLLYLDKALGVLQNNLEHPEMIELSQWFSRFSWNMAFTPDIKPKRIFEFFLRCCCFCELSPRNLTRLKNSLMLAAAAGLQVLRNKTEELDFQDILSKVLMVIDKCKSLETGSNVTLLRLLYLYEFEVKCFADHWTNRAEELREIMHLPFMDVKTLEHIAAIANEYMPNNHKVIIEALKLAAKKGSESKQSCVNASRTYHSLIEVMFYAQEYGSSSVEDDNFQLCSNLLNLIENMFEDYPQLEILWLMTKCWNWGIQKLTLNDNKVAYKWCTLAMAFLNKLNSLKTLHEKRLRDMYSVYFPDQVKKVVQIDI